MSGIEEILSWALDNFPTKNYDSAEEWFTDVSGNFIAQNRLPLDEILKDELDRFIGAWVPPELKGIANNINKLLNRNIKSEFTPKEISIITKKNPSSVRSSLSRMVKKGLIIRISRGIYRAK